MTGKCPDCPLNRDDVQLPKSPRSQVKLKALSVEGELLKSSRSVGHEYTNMMN